MNKEALEERRAHNEAMRTRIRLIAAERNLPAAEVRKVLGRLKLYDLRCFMRKHRINANWLIDGNLKGYLETVRGCPSRDQQSASTRAQGAAAEPTTKQIANQHTYLELRRMVREEIDRWRPEQPDDDEGGDAA